MENIIFTTIEDDLSDIDSYSYAPYYEKRYHSIYSETLDSGRYPDK